MQNSCFAAYGNSSFRVRCLTVVQVTRSPQDLCVWGEELDYPQVAPWYTGYSVRGGFRVLTVVKGSFCSWRALEGDFCSTFKVVTNTLSCPQVLCVCMMPGWLVGRCGAQLPVEHGQIPSASWARTALLSWGSTAHPLGLCLHLSLLLSSLGHPHLLFFSFFTQLWVLQLIPVQFGRTNRSIKYNYILTAEEKSLCKVPQKHVPD